MVRFPRGLELRMTFAAVRIATGAVTLRSLRNGIAFPVMEAFAHIVVNNVSTITVTKPSGTVTGNLLVLTLARRNTAEDFPGFTQNTGGWTPLWGIDWPETSTQEISHYSFFREVQGGDTNWVFNITGTDWAGAIVYRISGHDSANPIGAFSSLVSPQTGSTVIIPGAISDITNCLVLTGICASGIFSGGTPWTPPGVGETVIVNDKHSSQYHHHGAWENFAAGGGTGSRTWTWSKTTEQRHGGLIIINPIAGAPSKLELEGSLDHLLFEDSSGVLILE